LDNDDDRKSTDSISTVVTDQGSNFVRLFKQKENSDEEENVEIVSVDEVENEIMQINDEIEELKSSENISCADTEEDETVDTDILKQQEGGILCFVDDDDEIINEDNDDDKFQIKLGKFTFISFNFKVLNELHI
jgi:uncharacterized small protein (DUF1192 family)